MTSVAERYSRATTTSHLRMQEQPGDADVLVAAGWAGKSVSPIALTLWRMKHTGRPQGFHGVVSELDDWLKFETKRLRINGAKAKGKALVERVVYWWLHNTCLHCEGRGHPVFEGTPIMNEEQDCPECHGEGRAPLSELVNPAHLDAAKLLVDHIERISAEVFSDMKVSLHG